MTYDPIIDPEPWKRKQDDEAHATDAPLVADDGPDVKEQCDLDEQLDGKEQYEQADLSVEEEPTGSSPRKHALTITLVFLLLLGAVSLAMITPAPSPTLTGYETQPPAPIVQPVVSETPADLIRSTLRTAAIARRAANNAVEEATRQHLPNYTLATERGSSTAGTFRMALTRATIAAQDALDREAAALRSLGPAASRDPDTFALIVNEIADEILDSGDTELALVYREYRNLFRDVPSDTRRHEIHFASASEFLRTETERIIQEVNHVSNDVEP